MSIYIEGTLVLTLVSSVSFAGTAVTVVSGAFARSIRLPRGNRVLLSTVIPSYGTFSTSIQVILDESAYLDVSLGLDWASHLRETLLFSGHRPGTSFNAWRSLTDPEHPLSGESLSEFTIRIHSRS
jgi:hypothetical protein